MGVSDETCKAGPVEGRPSPPIHLWLMVGVPGSGKSTYARAHLAGKWRVSLDDLRYMLSPDAHAPRTQPVAVALEEASLRTLLSGIDGQYNDVVVDATNVTRTRRRRYLKLAASFGVPVIAVFLRCDLATALARNRARPQPVPDEVVERMYSNLQPPELGEGFEDVIYVTC